MHLKTASKPSQSAPVPAQNCPSSPHNQLNKSQTTPSRASQPAFGGLNLNPQGDKSTPTPPPFRRNPQKPMRIGVIRVPRTPLKPGNTRQKPNTFYPKSAQTASLRRPPAINQDVGAGNEPRRIRAQVARQQPISPPCPNAPPARWPRTAHWLPDHSSQPHSSPSQMAPG